MKVVLVVNGGVLSEVLIDEKPEMSTRGFKVLLVDYDTIGCDEADLVKPDLIGYRSKATMEEQEAEYDPTTVDRLFKQAGIE